MTYNRKRKTTHRTQKTIIYKNGDIGCFTVIAIWIIIWGILKYTGKIP